MLRGGSSSSKDKDGVGHFDPDELERGATALKEIDASPNAKKAFDLAELQERTKMFEITRDTEHDRSARVQLERDMSSAMADQARRTISHGADEERVTAQYKAEVEASLQGRKLELQKEMLEYQLKREAEQFMQHESIRIRNEQELEEESRVTMRQKAAFDRESAISGAKAEAIGRAQQERENVEVRLRELRAQAAEFRKTRLQSIEEVFTGLGSGWQTLYEDRAKAVTLITGLSVLAMGVYSARAASRVAASVMERKLGRPPLVRETSRWSWRPKIANSAWWPFKKEKSGIMDGIVLEEELAERLQWTTNALVSAQANGTPFRHLLLHGSPGTGKTLFARTLARQSGMDYAIMSGGDLGPLGREGPYELHKLFAWANSSKKGMVLFVDEADAFLRRGRAGGSSMSEDARNSLSVFLHHTGTESARVAVILATNVPSVLDRAVLDRVDEAFEFPKPAYDERVQLLKMFMERYLSATTKSGIGIELAEGITTDFLLSVAERTDGFSGRQLAKLVLAFQSAVFGSDARELSVPLAETVLAWRLAHPNS